MYRVALQDSNGDDFTFPAMSWIDLEVGQILKC